MENETFTSKFSTLSELKKEIGNEIGITEWLQVEQHNIDDFAKATLDYQWIHTDPQIAKVHSPYGTTIAHGFLILSLLPKLLYEAIYIDDAMMAVNYGLDRVRFPNAVPVNSSIRGRVHLKELEEIEEGARVVFRLLVELEGKEKPACVADMTVLIINQEKENI